MYWKIFLPKSDHIQNNRPASLLSWSRSSFHSTNKMWIKECTSSKRNKDGKWTKLILKTISTPSWRKLPTKSQSLYILVKLERKGEKWNNNRKIVLSCRQAAKNEGINKYNCLTAVSFWPPLPNMLFLRNFFPAFPPKNKRKSEVPWVYVLVLVNR